MPRKPVGVVAVLHGSANNSLTWMWLNGNRKDVVAKVDAGGFFFRDPDVPGAAEIAAALPRLWTYRVAGVNLSGHATHRLVPPRMEHIEPLPQTD